MQDLTAPPYDVIGEEEQRERARAHARNVVRLILPGDAGSAEDGSFYEGAARLLRSWREEGTLVLEETASFYPYRQTFRAPDGSEISRLGFFGALSLADPGGEGSALPHEKTLEAPREDRTRLIAACRANLSPIFLLHPDEEGGVGPLLRRAIRGQPLFGYQDGRGVRHEMWKVSAEGDPAKLTDAMTREWVLIADGHHRHESALAVKRLLPGVEGAGRVLAFFLSLRDAGFRIFPIHRFLLPEISISPDSIGSRIRKALPTRDLAAGSGPGEILEELRRAGPGWFGVAPRGVAPFLAGAGAGEPTGRNPLNRMDTVVLQRRIFEEILGIPPDAAARGGVGFTADASEALRRVASGEATAAFLLNPLRVQDVIAAARAGIRLPQKSTFFYPKIPTGLVIRPFDATPEPGPE